MTKSAVYVEPVRLLSAVSEDLIHKGIMTDKRTRRPHRKSPEVSEDLIHKGIMTQIVQELRAISRRFRRPDSQRDYDKACVLELWPFSDNEGFRRPDSQRDYDLDAKAPLRTIPLPVSEDLIHKGIMTMGESFSIEASSFARFPKT